MRNINLIFMIVISYFPSVFFRTLGTCICQNIQGVRLNRFKGNRDQMFELLRAHNEELVGKIEDEMYDFFILSRQNQDVLQTLLEVIPLDEWVVALKGAEPELVKAIQGAMPKRQAQQMESINRRQGPVPLSRVEQVRKDIMAVVREMSADGELQVQLFREQTVE